MRLLSARVAHFGPFSDLTFRFANEDGGPRSAVVVLGSGGTGKTSLLSAIAQTRPGMAMALPRGRAPRRPEPPFAVTEWALGQDDPARPHALQVAGPNAALDEDDETSLRRRREQAAFDRRAVEAGHVLLAFSGARWFSRTPVLLTAPDRGLLRYDVRAPQIFDDATRADLSRETKQALSYADIGARLADGRAPDAGLSRLRASMMAVVSQLTSLGGHRFVGADAMSLEPVFENESGELVLFDDLPNAVRHLAAFGALTVRALFAARPDVDPRRSEGVVLIDDAQLHQEPRVVLRLLDTLRGSLPEVQWILTSSSGVLGQPSEDVLVLALRRMSPAEPIAIFDGPLATLH